MLDAEGRVVALLEALISKGEQFRAESRRHCFVGSKQDVDAGAFEEWQTSCLTTLRSTFGSSSVHFDRFSSLTFFDYYNSTQIYLGILRSARQDVEEGYFFHKDLMLSVNIFDSLLTRAEMRVREGHVGSSAHVLEAVIEQILKKILDARHTAGAPRNTLAEVVEGVSAIGGLEEPDMLRLRDFVEWTERRTAPEGSDVLSWIDWARAVLNTYLASQIVILN